MIKVGSDFSGVGAFNQALMRLEVEYKEIFACDMDKFARQTFIHNYGEPEYYPTNVYDREIPSQSLDIYMTSPPCQAFSLAGKRLGKDDKRGILFFNSHEFIKINKPRYFIFENVKGLLSDDGGKTFQEWINMLGGKSINSMPVLFPYDDSVPYHIYWKVLNAKEHGVPQNRERVFIVGIRDDEDNSFRWPVEETLSKRLKDILEDNVDDKYFLRKMLELLSYENKGNIEIANINKGGQKGSVASEDGSYIGCLSATDYKLPKLIQVKSATSKGYEIANEGDSINFSFPKSGRRGRVGKGVAQTLDTGCQQGVLHKIGYVYPSKHEKSAIYDSNNIMRTLQSGTSEYFTNDNYKIRRLTPRECFRLMDFPDTFTWPVSDSQAYKQAGNSIVVRVLEKIIKNLNL